MVRPTKSSCLLGRRRNRYDTTMLKRNAGIVAADKESKLTLLRTNHKNDNHAQRDAAIECQV